MKTKVPTTKVKKTKSLQVATNPKEDFQNRLSKLKGGQILDVDLSTVADSEYAEYGVAVIEDRAIFSGIDGLKPVARRSLYAIHELGLHSSAKADKSAKAVGATLGNYHPHGDSACLHGETVVPLVDGSAKTIAELAKLGGEHRVLVHHEGIVKVATAHSFRKTKTVQSYLQIIVSSGESVSCTEDHKILTFNGWVEAGNLKIGDAIVGGTLYSSPDPHFSTNLGYNVKISQFNKLSPLGYTTKPQSFDYRFPAQLHNSVLAVRKVSEEVDVFDFTVPEYENMFVFSSDGQNTGNMLVVHNCYDAIVTAASRQNVAMIKGEGNFGTMTEGPAAMRYCFTEEARVMTGGGLLTFKELAKAAGVYQKAGAESEFKILVAGKDGNEYTSHVVCSGKQKTLKVVAGGYDVRCTPNEPFLTITESGYRWKDASELVNTDWVCMVRGTNTHIHDDICNERDLATARVLGYIVGDGYLNKGQNHIGFYQVDSEVFDDFIANWKASDFGKYPFVVTMREPSSFGKKEYHQFYSIDVNAIAHMGMLGLKRGDSYDREIPNWIWKKNKSTIAAFLSALFEADGSVMSCATARGTTPIYYHSFSTKLMDELRLILRVRFGIFAGAILDDRFIISGNTNVQAFIDTIGFRSEAKKEKVFVVNTGKSNRDSIPYADKLGFSRDYSITQRNTFRTKFEKGHFTSHAATEIYNRDYFHARVESVEEDGTEWVYDVCVPNGNSFTANGFVVHNTNLKLSKYSDAVFFDKFYTPVIEYVPNYDGSRKEPLVLPALLPNAIINGNFGIAPGVNTRSPMFKLDSVISLIEKVIANGCKCTPEMCLETLKFTAYGGGVAKITKDNKAEVLNFFKTGKGKINFVSTHTPVDKNNSIRFNLFAPISDMEKVMTKIEDLKGVQSTRDDSDENDPFKTAFVVIFVKSLKGDALDKVVAQVNAIMSSGYNYDVKVTDRYIRPNGQAAAKLRSTTIPQIVEDWLKYRISIEKSACEHWVSEYSEKIAFLNLMRLAISKLDIIIKHLKNKKLDDKKLKSAIAKDLKISEDEADCILSRNLRQLRHLEDAKLQQQVLELKDEIKSLNLRIKKPRAFILKHVKKISKSL